MQRPKQEYSKVIKVLKSLADRQRAKVSARFFKTGKGEYGAGDKFLGIPVPVQRRVAHRFKDLSFRNLRRLLQSPIHEHRFVALEILVKQYEYGDEAARRKIVKFYLLNARRINNWDLVDTSASYILGDYLLKNPRVASRKILYKLARSENLWERRIAIIATQASIQENQYTDTLKIAALLLKDNHDLIHKAVGWMLREVGKKDVQLLKKFLGKNKDSMPRTALRYAIEKFSEPERRHYLGQNK